MSKVYVFNVAMTCGGCEGAVKRILDRYKGNEVEDYKIDLPSKLVTIKTALDEAQITNIISKCGKDVTLEKVSNE